VGLSCDAGAGVGCGVGADEWRGEWDEVVAVIAVGVVGAEMEVEAEAEVGEVVEGGREELFVSIEILSFLVGPVLGCNSVPAEGAREDEDEVVVGVV
jgi:hypothetical protein